MNDGIEKELCLLKYVLVDEAMREARPVAAYRAGTAMAVPDLWRT